MPALCVDWVDAVAFAAAFDAGEFGATADEVLIAPTFAAIAYGAHNSPAVAGNYNSPIVDQLLDPDVAVAVAAAFYASAFAACAIAVVVVADSNVLAAASHVTAVDLTG